MLKVHVTEKQETLLHLYSTQKGVAVRVEL